MGHIHLYGKNVEKSYFGHLPLEQFLRFQKGPSVKRVLIICLNGSTPLNKMATMPIYGKKNLLLQNQESFEAES